MKKLLLLAAMALAFAAAPAWAQSGEPNDMSEIVPPTTDDTGRVAPQDGSAAAPSDASGQPAPSEPAPNSQPQ
ncbi:MAG: hypothetical protein LBV79_10075 [Candidatus Adiutrix sp.]|nr:hypothetical protein [Candidatus Adiutrix sp.]